MKSNVIVSEELLRDFSVRFKQIFPGENNASIARKLQTTDATVKLYADAKRLPAPEMLLRIHFTTRADITWLLTGKGEPFPEAVKNFDKIEMSILAEAASFLQISIPDAVRLLAVSGASFQLLVNRSKSASNEA